MTEFISTYTNRERNIIYIGHSMGVTGVMIYGSVLPDHAAQHLRGIIALAPAVFGHYNPRTLALRPIVDFLAPALRVS